MDGVLTCDPNIHPAATAVPFLTFDEAAELAYFGAQVLTVAFFFPILILLHVLISSTLTDLLMSIGLFMLYLFD